MNNIQDKKLSKNYFILKDKESHNNEEPNINYDTNYNISQNNNNLNFINKTIMLNNNFNNNNNIENLNIYSINNNINSFEKDNDNIFGLNFHQDEEEDENQVINSLHFCKFAQNKNSNIKYNKNFENFIFNNSNGNYYNNISNTNNYEQKVKNNRNILESNMKKSLIMDDEPFQISVSKYSESNNEIYYNNINLYNNEYDPNIHNNYGLDFYTKECRLKSNQESSKINNNSNINVNFNKNNSKNNILYNQKKKINNKNKAKDNSNKNYGKVNLKNNLLLNNNINNINLIHKKENKLVSNITNNKSFSSNKNIIKNKIYNNSNNKNNYIKVINNKPLKKCINIAYNTENNSNFYNNNQKKKYYTNRTHNSNISKIQNNNSFEYNKIKDDNFKKIYSKKKKAELDMSRGCFIYDKKYSNFDIKNGSTILNYIKFVKPTEPLIQINYMNIDKYYPLIRRKKFINELTNNNVGNNIYMNNNKNNIRKYQTFINKTYKQFTNNFSPYEIKNDDNNINNYNHNNELMKKKNKIPFPKNIFPSYDNIQSNNSNYADINNNYNTKKGKNNTDSNNNQIDKDGLSYRFKKKIYDWLIDIDIIKDKVIKIEYLPTLCINGVLLCDLINRCEGKNEIMKAIIRRTSTRSHIQVNINKVLEYLRTIEKFPSRHLWDNIEISKGNNLIIWELLDDIYNFYGNKKTFKKKREKIILIII